MNILFFSTGDPNLAALKAEQAAAAANASSNSADQSPVPHQEETTPRGLNNWREATARAHTSAQLAMALYMLEASIAWDKSIMKAVSLTPARKAVSVKLRKRCLSFKATTQYNELLTTTQASVGIPANNTNQILLRFLSLPISSPQMSATNSRSYALLFTKSVGTCYSFYVGKDVCKTCLKSIIFLVLSRFYSSVTSECGVALFLRMMFLTFFSYLNIHSSVS